jgi:nucleotide sugar dehydrogenase
MKNNKAVIGFIGQGWIGKNYADDFEKRGFQVVRYSLEEPFIDNKDAIKKCDVVFIAVPTPTTSKGFDYNIVLDALSNVQNGAIGVVKSTILPGTTEKLQKICPDIFILHSPEFLREKTAAYDASHPERNIVGIPIDNEKYRNKAKKVMSLLPDAPYNKICNSKEAEFIKYVGNSFLYTKVVFMNLLYDMSEAMDTNWEVIRDAIIHDSRIGDSHIEPIHQSGHGGLPGRGAGGDCFTKDFAALRQLYKEIVGDKLGTKVLCSIEDKNINLLKSSGKDINLVRGVYDKSK